MQLTSYQQYLKDNRLEELPRSGMMTFLERPDTKHFGVPIDHPRLLGRNGIATELLSEVYKDQYTEKYRRALNDWAMENDYSFIIIINDDLSVHNPERTTTIIIRKL